MLLSTQLLFRTSRFGTLEPFQCMCLLRVDFCKQLYVIGVRWPDAPMLNNVSPRRLKKKSRFSLSLEIGAVPPGHLTLEARLASSLTAKGGHTRGGQAHAQQSNQWTGAPSRGYRGGSLGGAISFRHTFVCVCFGWGRDRRRRRKSSF